MHKCPLGAALVTVESMEIKQGMHASWPTRHAGCADTQRRQAGCLQQSSLCSVCARLCWNAWVCLLARDAIRGCACLCWNAKGVLACVGKKGQSGSIRKCTFQSVCTAGML
eukprot:1158173-Pelagomonas_calceolata.AAC.3